jgi:hypothetical protein
VSVFYGANVRRKVTALKRRITKYATAVSEENNSGCAPPEDRPQYVADRQVALVKVEDAIAALTHEAYCAGLDVALHRKFNATELYKLLPRERMARTSRENIEDVLGTIQKYLSS